MKKETLGRSIVISLLIIATAIPFVGQWWFDRERTGTIDMHARMPENGGWSVDMINAEVNQPINIRFTSDDVIHGFAIGKTDQPVVENISPGEFTEASFTFSQPGKYTFYCTRWCGPNHWRMRGTIEVTGPGTAVSPEPQPLFIKLGLDLDANQLAGVTPSQPRSIENGVRYASLLPPYYTTSEAYQTNSPEQIWKKLRDEPSLVTLKDNDLWDVVYWLWTQQTSPQKLMNGENLYANNCAACHGETGLGDGVIARDWPVKLTPEATNQITDGTVSTTQLIRPPDFTKSETLLGISPAILEGKIIRGGNGTGMPYWGPVFTIEQINSLVSYLYTFAWVSPSP